MSAGISDVDRRTRGFKASLMRLRAAFIKELIQLRRDRITFAMMIMIPLLQLTLFGYAINTSPRHLPTAVLVQDDSAFARSFLAAMRATDYFDSGQLATDLGRRVGLRTESKNPARADDIKAYMVALIELRAHANAAE